METAEARLGPIPRLCIEVGTPAAEVRLGCPLPGFVVIRDSAALGAFAFIYRPLARLGPFALALTEELEEGTALTGCGTVLHTLKHLGTDRIGAPGEELDGGASRTAAGHAREE